MQSFYFQIKVKIFFCKTNVDSQWWSTYPSFIRTNCFEIHLIFLHIVLLRFVQFGLSPNFVCYYLLLIIYTMRCIFFFDKNNMIFIHSNREITLFNTAKNVKDEFVNKLTTSKLIAYNDIMSTKIYGKTKVTRISMASGSATLTPKSLIE